jgi:hypothetical protein
MNRSPAQRPPSSGQTVLDDRARAVYGRRAKDLVGELAMARGHADRGKAERLEVELDALAAELDRATGLGARHRAFTGPAERARTAVHKAIKRALDEIEAADPEIGSVLRPTIRTGSRCSHIPDGQVIWSTG